MDLIVRPGFLFMAIPVAAIAKLAMAGDLEAYSERLVARNATPLAARMRALIRSSGIPDLSGRYPIDALEEAFAEGIYVGHPDMPEFMVKSEQIDTILAYIESVW